MPPIDLATVDPGILALAQAGGSHRHEVLGFGPDTIGASGCTLVCVRTAIAILTGVQVPMALINAEARSRAAFFRRTPTGMVPGSAELGGCLLSVPALCQAYGLIVGPTILAKQHGHQLMAETWAKAMAKGHVVLAHVDHDATLARGDPEGDHFITGLAMTTGGVSQQGRAQCHDPQLGAVMSLPWPSLAGPAVWGRESRTYDVLSVRVISPA